jgi:hypothetical protein
VQLKAVNGAQLPVLDMEALWHGFEQSLAFERTISHVAPVALDVGQLHVHWASRATKEALPW